MVKGGGRRKERGEEDWVGERPEGLGRRREDEMGERE